MAVSWRRSVDSRSVGGVQLSCTAYQTLITPELFSDRQKTGGRFAVSARFEHK